MIENEDRIDLTPAKPPEISSAECRCDFAEPERAEAVALMTKLQVVSSSQSSQQTAVLAEQPESIVVFARSIDDGNTIDAHITAHNSGNADDLSIVTTTVLNPPVSEPSCSELKSQTLDVEGKREPDDPDGDRNTEPPDRMQAQENRCDQLLKGTKGQRKARNSMTLQRFRNLLATLCLAPVVLSLAVTTSLVPFDRDLMPMMKYNFLLRAGRNYKSAFPELHAVLPDLVSSRNVDMQHCGWATYIAADATAEGLKLAEKEIAAGNQSPGIKYFEGCCRILDGKNDSTTTALFEQALQSDPKSSLHSDAGYALIYSDYRRAATISNQLSPPQAASALALKFNVEGNDVQAEKYFNEAVRLRTSGSCGCFCRRALFYMDHDESQRAMKDIELAMQENKDVALPYLVRSWYYLKHNQLSEALKDSDEVLSRVKTSSDFYDLHFTAPCQLLRSLIFAQLSQSTMDLKEKQFLQSKSEQARAEFRKRKTFGTWCMPASMIRKLAHEGEGDAK